MTMRRTVKAEVFRGPLDSGSRPKAGSGKPMQCSFFAWSMRFPYRSFSRNMSTSVNAFMMWVTLPLDYRPEQPDDRL